MESNSLCSVCGGLQASVFCVCTSALSLLCTSCAQKHVLQPDFHYLLPLSSSSSVVPSNQLQYKVWLLCLRNSQDRLRENIREIDRCKDRVCAAFDTVEACLQLRKKEMMGDLEGFKGEIALKIEEAVRETDENAINYYYQPNSDLAAAIWKHSQENSSANISIFSYNVDISEELVAKCVKLELNSPIKPLENTGKKEFRHIGIQTAKERLEIPPLKRTIATSDPLTFYKSDKKPRICCNLCGKSRNPSNFLLNSQLIRHKMCKVCDNCFNKGAITSNCLVCGAEYSKDERFAVQNKGKTQVKACKRCLLPISEAESSSSLCSNCSFREKRCPCGAVMREKGPTCLNSCLCAHCLAAVFISTRSKKCPLCSEEVQAEWTEVMQCSYCFRPLKLRTESLFEGISGLCGCGALLCCFCIRVQGGLCYCPVSNDVFQPIADLAEVDKAQRGTKTGCYCAGQGAALAKLKCGHMVHNDCRGKIFRCRVCRAEVREPPKAKRLKDYLVTSG